MDDRSAVLHDWAQTEEWVRLWHDWSRAVGLKENSRKIQVAARGPAKVEVDRLCPPEWTKAEVFVLGTCSVSGPRTSTAQEEARLDKARKRQLLLRALWQTWPQFIRSSRMWSLSVAAYGWNARLPTLAESDKLFTAASVASATNRCASPHLRKFLYGAPLHLDCVAGQRLFGKLWKLRWAETQGLVPAGDRAWSAGPGSSTHVLRTWLRKRGWQVVAPWRWVHSVDGALALDLRVPGADKPLTQEHALRQGWHVASPQVPYGTSAQT